MLRSFSRSDCESEMLCAHSKKAARRGLISEAADGERRYTPSSVFLASVMRRLKHFDPIACGQRVTRIYSL
jgi:hypothetical protein